MGGDVLLRRLESRISILAQGGELYSVSQHFAKFPE